jgi:hypothetical protein
MQSIPPVRPIDPGARPPLSTETPAAERAPRSSSNRRPRVSIEVGADGVAAAIKSIVAARREASDNARVIDGRRAAPLAIAQALGLRLRSGHGQRRSTRRAPRRLRARGPSGTCHEKPRGIRGGRRRLRRRGRRSDARSGNESHALGVRTRFLNVLRHLRRYVGLLGEANEDRQYHAAHNTRPIGHPLKRLIDDSHGARAQLLVIGRIRDDAPEISGYILGCLSLARVFLPLQRSNRTRGRRGNLWLRNAPGRHESKKAESVADGSPHLHSVLPSAAQRQLVRLPPSPGMGQGALRALKRADPVRRKQGNGLRRRRLGGVGVERPRSPPPHRATLVNSELMPGRALH